MFSSSVELHSRIPHAHCHGLGKIAPRQSERLLDLATRNACSGRCGRRSGSAKIRDCVADSDVHFVSDRRNYRNRARDNRARNALVVEGPEVFFSATPSPDDDYVGSAPARNTAKRRDDLTCGAIALNFGGTENYSYSTGALLQDGNYVL